MKQIRDQSDASAFIVLNRKGEHRATVQYRYGSGGGVQCDVWSVSTDPEHPDWAPHLRLSHQEKAGGGGYDKAAAALSGAVIDGFMMANHCGHVEQAGERKRQALMRAYKARAFDSITSDSDWRKRAEKIGCSWANYRQDEGWTSLHNLQGLDRLRALGYRVIQAL